jgi:hypothetical protein
MSKELLAFYDIKLEEQRALQKMLEAIFQSQLIMVSANQLVTKKKNTLGSLMKRLELIPNSIGN